MRWVNLTGWLLGVLILGTAAVLAFYESSPPYEAQVRLFMFLHEKDVRALTEQFVSDKGYDRLVIGPKAGEVRIHRYGSKVMEENLPPKRAAVYWRLMVAAHMQLVLKRHTLVFYELGSLWKFDNQFNISILYFPESKSLEPYYCRGQYVGSIRGACMIPLHGPWYIYYHWMNIEKIMKLDNEKHRTG